MTAEIFERLSRLPPQHEFWKNKWMFTRPVFTSESRQMEDSVAFWQWINSMPAAFQRYVMAAPDIRTVPPAAA